MEGKQLKLEPEAMEALKHYEWPGNIREMENVMSYMVVLNQSGTVTHKEILEKLNVSTETETEEFNLQQLEKSTIIKVMNRYVNTTQGKKAAAKVLGISMATLYRKIETYHIEIEKTYKISQNEN
ncbi:MAG: transcriptional regulator containing AAA-type ATPase, and DNA-binding domain [Clostridia bacterium]|nr:transcriptional regulator containing AAA-type ATPase, and DNA-binding domain [Clostridia bacterium]